MTTVFQIKQTFGSFGANGEDANVFRFTEVEPALARGDQIVFDFEGVRNLTSSFANGLVATLMAHHPEAFTRQVKFKNCNPAVQVLLSGAIAIGRRESNIHA